MRLFVSVDLPDDLTAAVAAVQEAFRDAPGLDFTDPAQAHLTLKFLGDVEEARVETVERELERAVADAGVAPFEATFGGLGVFPDLDYVRVLWLGVESGGAEFTRLHEAVEARMTDLGFDPEDHAFTPHVTLARMTHAGGKELVRRGVRERDPTVGTTTVSEVGLTESVPTHDGPRYSTVSRVALG